METFEASKSHPEIKQRNEAYNKYVLEKMPKSKLLQGCVRAFIVGGLICALGQGIAEAAKALFGMDQKAALGAASITLVVITAFLTGIGVFDVIGKFGGAGSFVPITGFANSMVSPAMEHKREGIVMGVGANLFKIAGPVLVNGITAAFIYGIIYFLFAR